MICSTLLLPSCDKDHGNDNFYGYNVENHDGFDMLSITQCSYNQDTAFLTGIKNEKHWIGMFDEHTKEQLQEWNGTETIDRKETVGGYGEETTFNVPNFSISDISKTDWGFVTSPDYCIFLSTDNGYMQGSSKRNVLFLKDDKMIIYTVEFPILFNSHWFKESVVVESPLNGSSSKSRYIVLSPEGEEIVELKKKPSNQIGEENILLPTSYTDGIGIRLGGDHSYCAFRENYATTEILWETPIPSLTNTEGNPRINITVLEQKNPIWKYQIDITNYDGSKQHFIFTVDVETGKVTEV